MYAITINIVSLSVNSLGASNLTQLNTSPWPTTGTSPVQSSSQSSTTGQQQQQQQQFQQSPPQQQQFQGQQQFQQPPSQQQQQQQNNGKIFMDKIVTQFFLLLDNI